MTQTKNIYVGELDVGDEFIFNDSEFGELNCEVVQHDDGMTIIRLDFDEPVYESLSGLDIVLAQFQGIASNTSITLHDAE